MRDGGGPILMTQDTLINVKGNKAVDYYNYMHITVHKIV